MKQVLIQQGEALVTEVPAPMVEPGTILVAVDHSCISSGTELSGLRSSGMPLWRRALRQREKVGKALQMLRNHGAARTLSFVRGKLYSPEPTGYSAAGIVMAVGAGIADLRRGDRVACAGAQCAFHAEVIRVPRNLAVPIPDGVTCAAASTVALGAIAMQGVRRAQPTLGETFVVVGLGVVGQLTVQLLKASGCRVVGVDVNRGRIAAALELGMDAGIHPDDTREAEHVGRLTGGTGADGVVITAASQSDAVVATAFHMCRKKGRVVLVGDVGLRLNRWDFYYKELDFLISSSYGPGRYDAVYEEQGRDYPIGYVRWTENRNMDEYLRLIAANRLEIGPLIKDTYPIERATEAYQALKSGQLSSPIVLISYPRPQGDEPVRIVRCAPTRLVGQDKIRLALVGAGEFAKFTHLPNLQSLADRFALHSVVSHSGHNAATIARQWGAAVATTDYQQVLDNPEVNAVLICTRHHLHAAMALAALRAGKHVLVEKPLALHTGELQQIEDFFAQAGDRPVPVLLTGFNRRFSPFAHRIRALTEQRSNPMILNYRMNAGYMAPDHWYFSDQGGGRNLGEACHIYDLFTYLTGSQVRSVQVATVAPSTRAYSHRDNFVATMTFADGSVSTLTYTAMGSNGYAKEKMEVFVDGKVLVLDDYLSLTVVGAKAGSLQTKVAAKGHRDELVAFAECVRGTGEWPSPLWQQVQASQIALQVEQLLGSAT